MKHTLGLLLVLAAASVLGQDAPCTKSKNTRVYIQPAQDMSYVKDNLGGPNLHLVPNAAPFKSVEFDALLRQAVSERVHNITLLAQRPLNPVYGLGGKLLQGDPDITHLQFVMFVSDYNCAAPGSHCSFKMNIQAGGYPTYWSFPIGGFGGTMAAVSLSKSTPRLLEQAAESLADQMEKYRLEAEKGCLFAQTVLESHKRQKEALDRQRSKLRDEDAQDPRPTTRPQPPAQLAKLELLSDTQGVDFGPYLQLVLRDVEENWYRLIPDSAQAKKGSLSIEFAITRDGKIVDSRLASSSGDPSLDRAAWGGITASNPFPHLPSGFGGTHLALRFRFFYGRTKEDTE